MDQSNSEKNITIKIKEQLTLRDLTLTWEDLTFLSSEGWAMRHTIDIKAAEKESNEGIVMGDAVSLAAPQNFISDEFIKSNDLFTKYRISKYEYPIRFIPEEEKDEIILKFSQAIKNFMSDSIGMDVNSCSNYNTSNRELIELLTKLHSSFVIAKIAGANFPYDHDNYYGLGKCGKQNVEPENVVDLINLQNSENIVLDLGLEIEELNKPVDKSTYDKIKTKCVSEIWNSFIRLVRGRGN